MDDFASLRADLIARWRAAFGRVAEVERAPADAVETVYTTSPAFSLEGFTPTTFKPGARLSRTPVRDGDGYTFLLDASGRPVQVRFAHTVNGFTWQGIYRYAADEVEHLEICLQTGVPSLYERLQLADGAVIAEHRFICNSGGSHVPKTSGDIAQAILNDPNGYSLYLTRYTIERGVPVAAAEYHESGGRTHQPTRTYEYTPSGALQRIVQHWPEHGARTVFAAKSKATKKDLADELSTRIAAAVLEKLTALPATPRLIALELSYREHDSPIPLLVPLTEADHVDSLVLSAAIPADRWLQLAEEDFAPAITDFMARAAEADGTMVTAMVRSAARRVTERARAELPVAPTFVTFAIDWEAESDQLATILKQCGADADQLRAWGESGWV